MRVSAWQTCSLLHRELRPFAVTTLVATAAPPALSENIDTISPIFHHRTALAEVLSTIIGSAHCITLLMGKLALDHVRREAHFVERGRSHCPEAMNRCPAVIAHSV